MKKFSKLALISVALGSTSPQAMTIGATVAGGLWGENTDGGIGSNYAYVEGTDVTDGSPLGTAQYSYRAEATFNVGALTPVLRAEAFADDLTPLSDPNITGEAYGLQTYQNISATTQTYTLNLSLDGDVLKAPGSSYIDAEVGIFTGTDIVADFSSCGGAAEFMAGFGSWICGSQIGTGFTPFIEIADDGPESLTDSVSFDIAAGDTFTIYAELTALTFGGYADAFSTLGMTFDDTSNLAALGPMSAVPVPAAAWLFGSGLVGLIGVARRKA
jgi:hypothetical protein